jgi:thiamine-monophosphate kinase
MSGAEPDKGAGEFDIIARLFAPLAHGAPEALDLTDDAAVISPPLGMDLIVTKDAMVEGVHTPRGEARDLFARKLLRTNLSDLAAMGAQPLGAFLAVVWPRAHASSEPEDFARGLDTDLRLFGLPLLGGDTVSSDGPLVASLTLLGVAPRGSAVRRSGARPGDLICVSGPIGDGGLGLAAVQGELEDTSGYLARRYRLPDPRLDLVEPLRAHASACLDISDGLIADARHIATASRVRLEIDLERVPVSDAGASWLAIQEDEAAARLRLATSGDDYELLLTAAPEAAGALGLPVIGEVREGRGVAVSYRGRSMAAGAGGWRHL